MVSYSHIESFSNLQFALLGLTWLSLVAVALWICWELEKFLMPVNLDHIVVDDWNHQLN